MVALIKLLYIGKCTDAMGACIEVPHFLLAATFVDDTVAQIFPDTAPGSSSSKMHKVLHGLPQLHGDWVKAKIVAVHCLDLALQYHSANHADKKVSIPVFNKLAYVDMQLIPYPEKTLASLLGVAAPCALVFGPDPLRGIFLPELE